MVSGDVTYKQNVDIIILWPDYHAELWLQAKEGEPKENMRYKEDIVEVFQLADPDLQLWVYTDKVSGDLGTLLLQLKQSTC